MYHVKDKEEKLLFPTYKRYPLAVKKAKGSLVYDFAGKKYYDLLAGIAVCTLGHSHPAVLKTITEQAQKLIHISNLFYQEEQLELAERLVSFFPDSKVFLCNSGAEANEAAIKLVRRFFWNQNCPHRYEIITFTNSFHGRTLATLTATGQDKVKQGFAPLMPGFKTISFNDSEALKKAITENTAAILVESIQGEGGIIPLSEEFAKTIAEVCRKYGLLLIADEIQTGIGRTGSFFAHTHFKLKPHVVTLAKGLASGLPIGAVLAQTEIANVLGPGTHGTTFGGNALICKVACAVLDVIQRENLIERAKNIGEKFCLSLNKLQEKFPNLIQEVRAKGLMIGIELKTSGQDVWTKLLEQGFILNLTQDKILRLLPPLTIEQEVLDLFVQTLEKILQT